MHYVPFPWATDLEGGTVGVRSREEGDLGAMTVEAFLARLAIWS